MADRGTSGGTAPRATTVADAARILNQEAGAQAARDAAAAEEEKVQTEEEARKLDPDVRLPAGEVAAQGTGEGTFLNDPAAQQHVSGVDPGLANLLPPGKVTGDMKEDALKALDASG